MLTFQGTYTQNQGDAAAAGTVTVTHVGGATDTATLDADGSYVIELDASGGTVTIVETLVGVPVKRFTTGVVAGATINTGRDVGRVGFSGGGGDFSPTDHDHSGTLVATADQAASGKGFVNHGATAGTARPTGYASVEWFGSVEPTNALDGDTWVDTA